MSNNNGDDIVETLFHSVLSINNELTRYVEALGRHSQDAAEKLEQSFDGYADMIRQSMRNNSWVPDSIKPPAPRPPPRAVRLGLLGRCTDWIDRHRAISAAVVCFVGTTAFLVYRQRNLSRRKRRARRAPNGAKTEAVVLAGSPYAQTTKSIALDLEKRGFLVYIPVGSIEEEAAVAELRIANIHALKFDITSDDSKADMIEKLRKMLYHPQRHGTDRLYLASLVVVEGHPSTLETSPVQTISTSRWSDVLNSRVLYPISLTQTFLPLLASESTAADVQRPTTLVVVTSSNISSINAPTHALESVTTSALSSYVTTLKTELPRSIHLTHIRMGSLALQPAPASRLDVALARVKKFTRSSLSSSTDSSPSRPAPKADHGFATSAETRKLHHGIFDAVVGRSNGTVFLGRGALMYAIFGAVAPSRLVSRLMGYQPQDYKLEPSEELMRTKQNSLCSSSGEWEELKQSFES